MKILTYAIALSAIALTSGMSQTAAAEILEGSASEYKKTAMAFADAKASSNVAFNEMNNDEGVSQYKTATARVEMIKPAAGGTKTMTKEYNSDLFD